MRKLVLIFPIFILFVAACSDDIDSKINGMWQLKTVEENGTISNVDTVFFGIQGGAVFSFTLLMPNDPLIESIQSYGYASFPSENEMMISMDTSKFENGYFINISGDFLKYSGWDKYCMTFDVKQIDSKYLVISERNRTYSFNRH